MIHHRTVEQNLLENAVGRAALWPLLAPHHGGGQLVPLELPHPAHTEFDVLDRKSGIDWVQVLPDGQHRTWAARFEYRPMAEGRLTIRQKLPSGSTDIEMLKRSLALVDNRLMPNMTMQACFTQPPSAGGRPLSAAAVATSELYGFLLGKDFAKHAEEWRLSRRTRKSRNEPPPMGWWGLDQAWPEQTQYLFVTFELLAYARLPSLQIHRFWPTQGLLFDPVAISLENAS